MSNRYELLVKLRVCYINLSGLVFWDTLYLLRNVQRCIFGTSRSSPQVYITYCLAIRMAFLRACAWPLLHLSIPSPLQVPKRYSIRYFVFNVQS